MPLEGSTLSLQTSAIRIQFASLCLTFHQTTFEVVELCDQTHFISPELLQLALHLTLQRTMLTLKLQPRECSTKTG